MFDISAWIKPEIISQIVGNSFSFNWAIDDLTNHCNCDLSFYTVDDLHYFHSICGCWTSWRYRKNSSLCQYNCFYISTERQNEKEPALRQYIHSSSREGKHLCVPHFTFITWVCSVHFVDDIIWKRTFSFLM